MAPVTWLKPSEPLPIQEWLAAMLAFLKEQFEHIEEAGKQVWTTLKDGASQVFREAPAWIQAAMRFMAHYSQVVWNVFWINCATEHPFWTSLVLFTFSIGPAPAIVLVGWIALVGWLLQTILGSVLLVLLLIVGFGSGGIRGNSLASRYQSSNYGALTPSGGAFAFAQSFAQAPKRAAYGSSGMESALFLLGRLCFFVLGAIVLVRGVRA